VRVAQRPGSAAQDEEIAAAAACRAILEKEALLKEKELRLLRQKKNFAAEVQRRSLQPHRFTNEDDALRQMQRLVDLEDSSPPLEEFLRRTATKAIVALPTDAAVAPEKNAATDAGALTYLRSYNPVDESGGMPAVHQVGPAPEKLSAASAAEERTAVADDTQASAKAEETSKSGSGFRPAAAVPSAATAQTNHSSSEHSLPVEGGVRTHPRSRSGTPTEQFNEHSHLARALEATVEKRREDGEAAPALTIEADHTEEKQAPPLSASAVSASREQNSYGSDAATSAKAKSEQASPGKASSKPAESRHHHISSGKNTGGVDRVIHIEVPRRRVKVKVRRRRSQSCSHARSASTNSEGDERDEVEEVMERRSYHHTPARTHRSPKVTSTAAPPAHERRSSSAPSYPASTSRDAMLLLPPPPSPATNSTPSRRQFVVDPLYQVNPSVGGQQQPWATANWPCGNSATGLTGGGSQKSKDGPPALWYASNSPVPLSQHEFKSLLCSEYKPPETTYAMQPEERVGAVYVIEDCSPLAQTRRQAKAKGTVVPPLSSDTFTPEHQRTGRELYEPYENTVDGPAREESEIPLSGKAAAAAAAARRGSNSNRRVQPRRRSVQVRDPAWEAEEEEAFDDDDEVREEARARGKPRARGRVREQGRGPRARRTSAEADEEEMYSSRLSDADGRDGGDAHAQPPSAPPPPPAPVFAEDGESVVEFPPPPHLMASDMPPPGDVGSDDEDSCCGWGCCGGGCCGEGCCSCWGRLFSCLFPCCCGPRKPKKPKKSKKHKNNAEAPPDPQRPLAFQRPLPAAAPNQANAPTQVFQQEPYNGGAIRYRPDPSTSPQEQLQQQFQVQQQRQQQLRMKGPPVAQVQGTQQPLPALQPTQAPSPSPLLPNVRAPTAQPQPQPQPRQQQQQASRPSQPAAPAAATGEEETVAYSSGGVGNTIPNDPAVNGGHLQED
jgi:hypothetical protein